MRIIRNPYAVCESIRRRTGCPLEVAALHWKLGNERLIGDSHHLDKLICIRYEDLCDDTVDVIDKLSVFLGFDRMDFRDGGHLQFIPSSGDRLYRINNLNGESIQRLTTDEVIAIERIVGTIASPLGYEAMDVGKDATN